MALKYATNCEHVILGKPEETYFMHAIEDLGLTKDEVVMVGDDIVSDVAGAQSHGIRGIQVRTGKWRSEWEDHYVKPDLIADDLSCAVKTILGVPKAKDNGYVINHD
jgi:phospholysine phosphohistidine inorganic pyrophosphate phosphatase